MWLSSSDEIVISVRRRETEPCGPLPWKVATTLSAELPKSERSRHRYNPGKAAILDPYFLNFPKADRKSVSAESVCTPSRPCGGPIEPDNRPAQVAAIPRPAAPGEAGARSPQNRTDARRRSAGNFRQSRQSSYDRENRQKTVRRARTGAWAGVTSSTSPSHPRGEGRGGGPWHRPQPGVTGPCSSLGDCAAPAASKRVRNTPPKIWYISASIPETPSGSGGRGASDSEHSGTDS